jgi:hypothetical protein
MFVHYFTHIPLPMPEVERRVDLVRGRMVDMADVAYREGEQLRSKVSPWDDGFAKEVDMRIGIPQILNTGIAYPITWIAHGGEILFPALTAELVLAHVGPDTTRIALEGTYEPPFGVVGKVADRALLGRYADATVRHWVDRLAEALVEEELSARQEQ